MQTTPLMMILAATVAGFVTACDCTAVGCAIGADQGIRAVATDAADVYAANLPVTLHLCVDAACADFTLAEKDGKVQCDDGQKGSDADTLACSVLNGKDVEMIFSTAMPKASSEVTLTVKDAGSVVLLDKKSTVQVAAYEPNGAMCGPSCRTAEATFSPGPASQ